MSQTRWAMIAAVLTLSAASAASAATIPIGAAKDTSIFSNKATNTAGGNDVVYIGLNGSGDSRRALMQFDVAGNVPAGSTITAVTLTLYLNDWSGDLGFGADRTIGAHRVTSAWGNGTTGSGGSTGMGGQGANSAANGDVSWFYSSWSVTNPSPPHTAWMSTMFPGPTDGGGDYEAVASASLTIHEEEAGDIEVDTPHSWSGAGLVADVQAWLDGSSPNNGWLLRELENDDGLLLRFYSREYATSALRPVLSVTYVPEPATWLPTAWGLGAIGLAGRMKRQAARGKRYGGK